MVGGRSRRFWNGLAVLTVFGALASIAGTANSSQPLQCFNDSDCGCTQQNCSAPGQGGACVPTGPNSPFPSYCQCNPGYAEPFCEPLGACCGVSFNLTYGLGTAPSRMHRLTAALCNIYNGTFGEDRQASDSSDLGREGRRLRPAPTATATATRDGDGRRPWPAATADRDYEQQEGATPRNLSR